jgi:hypothetical protein
MSPLNRFAENALRFRLSFCQPPVKVLLQMIFLFSITLLGVATAAAFAHAGFITAPAYPAGPGPGSVASGDFNGDGVLDLAVTNYNGQNGAVSILLGKGDGSFQGPQSYAAGPRPVWVAVGDFNSDRKLDLVVADYSGTLTIFLGNGDGTFEAAQSYVVGSNASSAAGGGL